MIYYLQFRDTEFKHSCNASVAAFLWHASLYCPFKTAMVWGRKWQTYCDCSVWGHTRDCSGMGIFKEVVKSKDFLPSCDLRMKVKKISMQLPPNTSLSA